MTIALVTPLPPRVATRGRNQYGPFVVYVNRYDEKITPMTDEQYHLLAETVLWARKEAELPEILRDWYQGSWVKSAEDRKNEMEGWLAEYEAATYPVLSEAWDKIVEYYTFYDRDGHLAIWESAWGKYIGPEADKLAEEIRQRLKYACSAAYCIAGQIAARSDMIDMIRVDDGDTVSTRDPRISIERYAAQKVGLTENEHGWLFSGGNTIERINQVANEILEDRGYEPLAV